MVEIQNGPPETGRFDGDIRYTGNVYFSCFGTLSEVWVYVTGYFI